MVWMAPPRRMPIKESFRRLSWIGLHERRVRLRHVHAEEVDLLTDAADHSHRLAEVHLRMPRRMRQRHEGLAQTSQRRTAPVKQRHTTKRIFERLRDEHGYVPVPFDSTFCYLPYSLDHVDYNASMGELSIVRSG